MKFDMEMPLVAVLVPAHPKLVCIHIELLSLLVQAIGAIVNWPDRGRAGGRMAHVVFRPFVFGCDMRSNNGGGGQNHSNRIAAGGLAGRRLVQ